MISESVEWWFVEDQAFSRSYDLTPYTPCPPLVSKLDRRYTGRLRKSDNLMTGGGRGKGRSKNMRLPESLVLYQFFNTLWMLWSLLHIFSGGLEFVGHSFVNVAFFLFWGTAYIWIPTLLRALMHILFIFSPLENSGTGIPDKISCIGIRNYQLTLPYSSNSNPL